MFDMSWGEVLVIGAVALIVLGIHMYRPATAYAWGLIAGGILAWGIGDALWLRVVDVAAALAGRRYRSDGAVVLSVADEFCEWNDGTWSLRVQDGIPLVEPADDGRRHAETVDLVKSIDVQRAGNAPFGAADRVWRQA